ncbi:MAG TPA: T9SS type A sorting domain-containing protein [Puia sp.]|jgi:hypothetical protein|nr:T9SS type A sorting domain-containing protein [Puia sp.]
MKTILNFFKIAILLFILSGNAASAQVCSNPGGIIYSLSNAGGIYPITVSNVSVGSVVNSTSYGTSSSANSIGYNSQNGLFYYFQAALSGPKQFVSYNPVTNVYTTLAPSPITATVNRGCINFNGTGYYCLDVNSNLYYYNIATNAWTFISSTFKDQFNNNVSASFITESSGDMAIDGYGNLWIVCSNGTQYGLYKMAAPLPTSATASITVTRMVAPTTSTPGAGFTGIAFSPTGDIYMATSADLYILKTNFTLTHLGTFTVAGVSGDLTSCSYPFSVLPVNFLNFAASENNDVVSLDWTVSQSDNNKGFYIEKSIDGKNWSELGFVGVTANDYSGENNYSFADPNPQPGSNYYRIKEVDFNNSATYSETKIVSLSSTEKIAVWPNPAKDMINVQTNGYQTNVTMEMYDLFGKKVLTKSLQPGNNSINIGGLPAGTYIVHYQNAGGETENHKIIKN